jgi:hypothetical protein
MKQEYVWKHHRVTPFVDGSITLTIKAEDGTVFDVLLPRAAALMLNVDLDTAIKTYPR